MIKKKKHLKWQKSSLGNLYLKCINNLLAEITGEEAFCSMYCNPPSEGEPGVLASLFAPSPVVPLSYSLWSHRLQERWENQEKKGRQQLLVSCIQDDKKYHKTMNSNAPALPWHSPAVQLPCCLCSWSGLQKLTFPWETTNRWQTGCWLMFCYLHSSNFLRVHNTTENVWHQQCSTFSRSSHINASEPASWKKKNQGIMCWMPRINHIDSPGLVILYKVFRIIMLSVDLEVSSHCRFI